MKTSRSFEKIFDTDQISKRERVERILNHQPVDRAALHDQLSFNSGVISLYTGRKINGFDYTLDDIGETTRKAVDTCFPLYAPYGTGRYTDEYGFVFERDNWTTWHVSRPFEDEAGAAQWLRQVTKDQKLQDFDPNLARRQYRDYMTAMQSKVGETVMIDYSFGTGLCYAYDRMGLELFSYFYVEEPEVMEEYMEAMVANTVRRIHAVADMELSPVVLIAEDFSTKQGPIFGPEFLGKHHYPHLKRVAAALKSHGLKVLYHSDGNYKKVIPDLMATGIDGFYCLEPNCGMDIVELKKKWPQMVWAGGVDGVELMERGTPEEVRKEVHRHILETNVLQTGGMLVATSSEVNPPIKPENFKAMVDAVGELLNPDFHTGK